MSPANTGFGRLRIIWKSAGLSVSPNSNISSIKMGITIRMVIVIGERLYSLLKIPFTKPPISEPAFFSPSPIFCPMVSAF